MRALRRPGARIPHEGSTHLIELGEHNLFFRAEVAKEYAAQDFDLGDDGIDAGRRKAARRETTEGGLGSIAGEPAVA
jgi:hypothetical protein